MGPEQTRTLGYIHLGVLNLAKPSPVYGHIEGIVDSAMGKGKEYRDHHPLHEMRPAVLVVRLYVLHKVESSSLKDTQNIKSYQGICIHKHCVQTCWK